MPHAQPVPRSRMAQRFRSEEHTSELQSRSDLVCRLLLEKKKCCALTDTVRLTAHAMKAGCAGVLMLPPFYYKGVSDEELFRSFAEVIERVGDRRLRGHLY